MPSSPTDGTGPAAALSALAGRWINDKGYARQYLIEGARIQAKWCGFSWPPDEIERREQVVENDPHRLVYDISVPTR